MDGSKKLPDMQLDFEYETGGITTIYLGHDTARRIMPSFLCTCPINISIEVHFDDRPPLKVEPPQVLIIPDNIPHSIRAVKADGPPVSLWCHFRPTVFRSVSLGRLFHFGMVHDGERAQELRRITTELVTLDTEAAFYASIQHKMLGFRLTSLILENATPKPDSQKRSDTLARLAPALKRIRSDIRKRHSTEELAATVGVSPSRFLALFQSAVGMPPGNYREQLRLQAACSWLSRGNMTLDAIADKLGFCDAFHFSRRFTRLAGVSPGAYRKQLL